MVAVHIDLSTDVDHLFFIYRRQLFETKITGNRHTYTSIQNIHMQVYVTPTSCIDHVPVCLPRHFESIPGNQEETILITKHIQTKVITHRLQITFFLRSSASTTIMGKFQWKKVLILTFLQRTLSSTASYRTTAHCSVLWIKTQNERNVLPTAKWFNGCRRNLVVQTQRGIYS